MPFTEVVYRRKNSLDLSETELAVMHRCNFQSNSTAACQLSSMDDFLTDLEIAISFAESSDYRKFLRTGSKPATDFYETFDAVRFVQLPKDYYRPHSDCLLFGELAWKEDGIMKVEASNFALCMVIWRMKQWVVLSSETYPLPCKKDEIRVGESWRLYDCFCRNLLHVISTDETLQKFLKDEGIVNWSGHVDRRLFDQLHQVIMEIEDYCRKLITGEEMISRSSRLKNVVFSLQLQKVLEKLQMMNNCVSSQVFPDDW